MEGETREMTLHGGDVESLLYYDIAGNPLFAKMAAALSQRGSSVGASDFSGGVTQYGRMAWNVQCRSVAFPSLCGDGGGGLRPVIVFRDLERPSDEIDGDLWPQCWARTPLPSPFGARLLEY